MLHTTETKFIGTYVFTAENVVCHGVQLAEEGYLAK